MVSLIQLSTSPVQYFQLQVVVLTKAMKTTTKHNHAILTSFASFNVQFSVIKLSRAIVPYIDQIVFCTITPTVIDSPSISTV